MFAAGYAQKLGMTHIYEANRHIPVTILKMPEQLITALVSNDKVNTRVQIGAVTKKNIAKPQKGELAQKNISLPISKRKELSIESTEEVEIGKALSVTNFAVGDSVVVTGTSKGKGFSGGIKRHGWSRGPMSHGSKHHRAPGSIGSGYPQRVVPGKRLPGHKGTETTTIRGNRVVAINPTNITLAVSGPVPGPNRSYVFITKDWVAS
jgi:large subunit ribosomal protein L3